MDGGGAAPEVSFLPACFMRQNSSMPLTCGSTVKFQGGGGEAVDHSSVRPFPGSPVVSRRRSRVLMLYTSCAMVKARPAKMTRAPANATHMSGCQDMLV